MRGDPPDGPRLASRLHGRRRGKTLRPGQHELIRTLLPRLSIDPSAIVDPSVLFDGLPREIWLEVGFGSGEHLVAAAAQNPDVGFIGCEPFLNGIARTLSELASRDLDNVRLHCGDACDIIDRLPQAALDRVLIFYPDPWPKRRQRKRRFMSDSMLASLARVMREEAQLRFVTDIDDYSGWTLARLARSSDFEWIATAPMDWQEPWPGWVASRYETKAKKEGRRPCYVTARRIRPRLQSA